MAKALDPPTLCHETGPRPGLVLARRADAIMHARIIQAACTACKCAGLNIGQIHTILQAVTDYDSWQDSPPGFGSAGGATHPHALAVG